MGVSEGLERELGAKVSGHRISLLIISSIKCPLFRRKTPRIFQHRRKNSGESAPLGTGRGGPKWIIRGEWGGVLWKGCWGGSDHKPAKPVLCDFPRHAAPVEREQIQIQIWIQVQIQLQVQIQIQIKVCFVRFPMTDCSSGVGANINTNMNTSANTISNTNTNTNKSLIF